MARNGKVGVPTTALKSPSLTNTLATIGISDCKRGREA
jgi:hypothetical protein